MAILKDLIVSGPSRLIGDVFTNKLQLTQLIIPTTSNGSTYGAGTSGQVLKSNGTSVYWGADTDSLTGVKGNAETSYRTGEVNLTQANIIGSTAIGSTTRPIYWTGSVFSGTTANVGSTTRPIYLNAGVLSGTTATVGGTTRPVYLNGGVISGTTATVGTTTKPIFMSSGVLTAGSYELKATINSSEKNKIAYYSGANTISGSVATSGSLYKGVFLSSGVITPMTYEIRATVNSGTSSKLAYYSGNNAISSYTSTIGGHTKGMWLSGGVPTAMSGTVGTTTKPVYMSSGTITAGSYELKSTVNSGATNKIAYYSGNNAISGSVATSGSLYKGVFLSSGVITPMTYEIRATINSGTTGKIAYYSGNNAISGYTSTIGGHTKGMWLSGGVPTVMSGTVGTAVKPIYMSSGTLTAGSYELKATVNSGATNKVAYYSGNNAISGSVATSGSLYKGVFLSSGVITPMTYELKATVNSGSTNKIAYYSGNNAISGYTSTVGSHTKGIWLSEGVPTAMSGTVGTATQPIYMSSGTLTAGTALGTAAYTASGTYASSGHTHNYLPLSGGTMTGALHVSNSGVLTFDYTAGTETAMFVLKDAANYGIRYKEGNPDTMKLSASGNANSDTEADFCINGHGAGTLTTRNNRIPHTGNTTGNVGSATTPVYVSGGVITAGTALGTAAYQASGYFATSGHVHTIYPKWQTSTITSQTIYDYGVYSSQGGSGASNSGPTGSNYYVILNVPYRKASGNTKPDYGWQLAASTSNDSRLWYRTSSADSYGSWQTIAHVTTSTSATGSAANPVYVTSGGVITACYSMVNWFTASNTSASASGAHDQQGARMVSALQSFFSGHNDSRPAAVQLSTGNLEVGFGYFLAGTSYNTTGTAYGGWFIPHYDVPRYTGIAGGVWRNHRLLCGPAAGYTGTSLPANSAGFTNQVFFLRL